MPLKDKPFIVHFHRRNTIYGDGRSRLLAGIAYAEDIVKYTEILITPEVVLQSTFPRFLLNCSARIRQVGPAIHSLASKSRFFLFCATRSLISGTVTYVNAPKSLNYKSQYLFPNQILNPLSFQQHVSQSGLLLHGVS